MIAPPLLLNSKRPTGRRTSCSSARAQGRRDPVLFVRAFHRHFSSAGGSNVLAPSSSPHECFLFGCCHWEKTHKRSLCIFSHTLSLSNTHSADAAMCSPGLRISPSLSLSAAKCWQTTEPWCRTVTGLAVCKVLGWGKGETKGPLVWWLAIMAAQLAVKGPLTPSPLQHGGERSAAPGSARSQTIREMAEGFSCFKPGCTVQINEGIVSISELMGVTSEAPVRILKTRALRTKSVRSWSDGALWPSLESFQLWMQNNAVFLPSLLSCFTPDAGWETLSGPASSDFFRY